MNWSMWGGGAPPAPGELGLVHSVYGGGGSAAGPSWIAVSPSEIAAAPVGSPRGLWTPESPRGSPLTTRGGR